MSAWKPRLELDREEPVRPMNAVVIELQDDGVFNVMVHVKADDKAVIEKLQTLAHALTRSGVFSVIPAPPQSSESNAPKET